MRRLVAYVHIAGRVFAPGDQVPDEIAERITNPAAWADSDEAEPQRPDPGASARTGENAGAQEIPPLSGRGSGKDAWTAYAQAHGVDVPDGASREDIVTALREADVPVERQEQE